MHATTTRYLSRLRDPETDDRQQLVAALRDAAGLLDGTTEQAWDLEPGSPLADGARHRAARQLREAAARLCDHARIGPDDRCRYCDALVVEPG